MALPNDDFILLSLVNTHLRDGGDLRDFCERYGAEEGELFTRLNTAGYTYDEETNSFKRI